MKNKLFLGAMIFALTACSEQRSDDAMAETAADMAGAPNIAITAAPGVAFNYRYAFRLADDDISGVQETHAAACEALGINRCRITGLDYRLVGDTDVEGQLTFKLDPAIARKFGKDAIASVAKAKGVLAAAAITGDDVGSQIDESQRRSSAIDDDLARLDARLKQGGLGDRERTELQQQIAERRAELSRERNQRLVGAASLATTPMTFEYQGTGGLAGIGHGNPFRDAAHMLVRSGAVLLSFLLVIGAAIAPWAALFALLIWLWRTTPMVGARRWFAGKRNGNERVDNPAG